MAYNLDVFEKLVFTVPAAPRLRRALVVTAFLYGGLAYWLADLTTGFHGGPAAAGFLVAVFLGPSLVTGLAVGRFPDVTSGWGYLLALFASTASFVALALELLVGPTVGWRLVGFGAVFVMLTNAATLVLAAGTDHPFALLGAASPVPAALLAVPVAGARWYGLPAPDVDRAVLAMSVVVIGLAASVFVHERLFDANVPYIDGARLTSTLLTRREEDIDAGYPHEPRVQALAIDPAEDDADRFTFAAPWVHPGPIVNFGGGSIADNVIDGLNDDHEGFYLKVPCTHASDPSEVAVSDRVLEAVPAPTTTDRATKLLHREYAGISFHGRQYGDTRVVFLEPERYGDFPISIVAEQIDPATTLIVDRHAYEPDGERGVRYDSIGARRLRNALDQFLADLEDAPLAAYSAGTAVDTDGKQLCALVEQVDGQRTLLFGSNENEVSPTVRDLEGDLDDEFDHVAVYSTDTHHSMHDLAVRDPVESDRIRSVIEEATDAVGPASAGLAVDRAARTRLLGTEYYALMYTINYVLRSFTVSLAVLYLLAFGVMAV